MTKNNLYHRAWKLRATGALLLALALSTFPAAFSRAVKAQTPAKATSQTPAKATAAPATESKGGQKEGIKVHGHWTIDVRNPDGKLVTHREFENALQAEGALYLSYFLARQKTVGLWEIGLGGYSTTSGPLAPPCLWNFNSVLTPTACIISEPTVPRNADPKYIFKNLTVNVPGLDANNQPLPNFQKLVLSGTATAARAGTIIWVTTVLWDIDQVTGSGATRSFTIAGLSAPASCLPNTQCEVSVVAGQIIQVTVVISFS